MAKGDQIGAYGPICFETSMAHIRTFEELREENRARYATHDVLNLEQKLQFLGLELIKVGLTMKFHQAFCVPQDELTRLRQVVRDHKAHTLMIGGLNLGEFVLEELTGTWTRVANDGVLLFASADVRLKEYR
jgi:phage protein U